MKTQLTQSLNTLEKQMMQGTWQDGSADWQSAVSQVGTLRSPAGIGTSGFAVPADCQSAKQQTNCLRHENLRRGRQTLRGFLEMDMMVGMVILTLAVLPLAYSFARERRALKLEYGHCVAAEIVDGELELLAAGAARNLPAGSQPYTVHARAASQLPPGHFQLTKTGNHLRLEWRPDARRGLSPVIREATLP